ncbi:MAG: fumarylacetoacetase [Lewinellaceae bacterium]|nr:fumarylacetoacetase [Lewinellaceae bacterium]
MIQANDPSLTSWIEVPAGSDFPIQNLPFGVFRTPINPSPRLCTAIGNFVVDLPVLNYMSVFDELDFPPDLFVQPSINGLMKQGKQQVRKLRNRLAELLSEENEEVRKNAWHFLHPMEKVELLMPVEVGDYTDFYSSIEHATNVGMMFRDPANALLPNWRHLPVGYHGRSSSIVVSGTPFHRPSGQTRPKDDEPPVFGPSRQLDFELETAFIIGRNTELGQPVSTAEAEDYIFGMVLFNDWSARDLQQWEYVPLGPFLGKNFASSISPWVVTLDALEPFRVNGPEQEPAPLSYLQFQGARNYDIQLEVAIRAESGAEKTVCQSNFSYMYWNMCQQLVHHTVNGCNVRVGDLCASGTISGPTPGSYGSMLEIAWKGTRPVDMPDGSKRSFLQDGDTVIVKGWAEKDGLRIGFGEATGQVLPAL